MTVAAHYFTAVVVEKRAVYAWGSGFYGQLVLGSRQEQLQPGRVGGAENPVTLSPAPSRPVPPNALGACRGPRLSGNTLLVSQETHYS